jgi:hypothetical protein
MGVRATGGRRMTRPRETDSFASSAIDTERYAGRELNAHDAGTGAGALTLAGVRNHVGVTIGRRTERL